jgi:hypothetical protein
MGQRKASREAEDKLGVKPIAPLNNDVRGLEPVPRNLQSVAT